MKILPVGTGNKIGFDNGLKTADTEKELGNFNGACTGIELLLESARQVHSDCADEYRRLLKTLNEITAPEGLEPDVVGQGVKLRKAASEALDLGVKERFDFEPANIAIVALRDFYKSAPRTAALRQKNPAVADAAKHALGEFDRIINDGGTSNEAREKAATGRRLLIAALNNGPLSGETARPLKEDTAKKLIQAYAREPDLANFAAGKAGSVRDPDAMIGGLDAVIGHYEKGFQGQRSTKLAPKFCKRYAAELLEAGGHLGPRYFERFEEWIQTNDPDDCDGFKPVDAKTAMRDRSNAVAKSLIVDGKLVTDGAPARQAVGDTLFKISSFLAPTPAFNASMLDTLDVLAQPQATEILANIGKPAPGSAELVRASGGGKESEVGPDEARVAVVASMLKPMQQGSVGSCFATAPCRLLRQTEPLTAMQALADIATKGTYKPPNGDEVPVVTRYPDGDDPLLRSWEYSLATSSARKDNSRERTELANKTVGAIFSGRMKVDVGLEGNDPLVDEVREAIKTGFSFDYDSLDKFQKLSKDQSSKQGRFVIRSLTKDKQIRTREDLVDDIVDIIMAVLKDKSPNLEKIRRYVTDGVEKYDMSELEGGSEDGATVALLGQGAASKPMTPAAKQPSSDPAEIGKRSADILASFLDSSSSSKGDMVTLRAVGIHAFNGLPNHPSLNVLKNEQDGDAKNRVQKHLVEKGKVASETAITLGRVQAMFKKSLADEKNNVPYIKFPYPSKGQKELDELLEKIGTESQPDTPLTPAELQKHVSDVLAPYFAQAATHFKDPKSYEQNCRKAAAARLKSDLVREVCPAECEFVIADTNWGDPTNHVFFVIAPDPTTGHPALWKKTEPPGMLSMMDGDWTDKEWAMCG